MAAQLQATHMYSILELVSGLVQPLLSRKPKLPQNPPTKLLITFHGQWRTGKPGMLQSMWSHRVGHDLATEQGQNCITGPLEDEGRPDIRYLPWFTDLTFQVSMQYCSLQHRTLLSPPDSSRTGCGFCFNPISPFLLELFLHSSLVVYWTAINLGAYLLVSYFFAFSHLIYTIRNYKAVYEKGGISRV